MQASKLLPIGALALAFAIGPAQAAPATPATSPLGKSEASATTQVQWGHRVTTTAITITGAAGERPRGSGSAPAS